MKKVSLILLSIATMGSMLFVGCKKDTQTVTLGVKLESATADGKLYIDGYRNPVFLANGEQINVNGRTLNVVKNDNDPNYKVTVDFNGPYYAAYPATLPTASTGFSGTTDQLVHLSRWQKYECDANGVQNVKLPAAAVITDNSNKLLFYNLCSLLEIQWTNASNAAYDIIGIEVTVPDQALYGDGRATLNGTSSKITMTAPITNNRVNLDIANNYRETVAAGAASRKYYVVLPTFSNKNVTVRIQTLKHNPATADDQKLKTVTVSTSAAVTLLRNTIVPMHMSATPKEDNSLTGYFSISDNLKVVFSRGNLQHVGSTSPSSGTWKFADRQYDFFGDLNYVNAGYSSSETRDLFTWSENQKGDYGLTPYDDWNDQDAWNEPFLEWGKKSIMPSTDATTGEANVWFTLTDAEWDYLINERVVVNRTSKAPQLRGKATITGIINHPAGSRNSVDGFILLPDDWETEDVPADLSFNSNGNNQYNIAQWARMEAAGAMFLPAAGWARDYGKEGNAVESEYNVGHYWSSTNIIGGRGEAYFLYLEPTANDFARRSSYDTKYYSAKSVRLVKAAPGYTVTGRWN